MTESHETCWGYRFEGFELNLLTRELRRGEEPPRHLQPRAFELLAYLVGNRCRVVSKEEVLKEVWGGASVCSHAVPQCVSVLRKALGDTTRSPRLLSTRSGVGYRFVSHAEPLLANPAEIR
jgi:DNA-binding winged helix-turn-helix (wHTH) protein